MKQSIFDEFYSTEKGRLDTGVIIFGLDPWDRPISPSPLAFEEGVQYGRGLEFAAVRRDSALPAAEFARRYLGAGEPEWALAYLSNPLRRPRQLENNIYSTKEIDPKENMKEPYQQQQVSGKYILGVAEGIRQVRAEVRADGRQLSLPEFLQKYSGQGLH